MWTPCVKLYQGQFKYKTPGRHYISWGWSLLFECEHKQDAMHHKLVNKLFQEETKQEQGIASLQDKGEDLKFYWGDVFIRWWKPEE